MTSKRIRIKEWVKKKIVSLYDAAIVGGLSHQAYLVKLGMPVDQIFPSYNVVDNDFWGGNINSVGLNSGKVKSRLTLPENYFLSVGRFIGKKNFAHLIDAYSKYIIDRDNPWDLVIVGDGPLRESLLEKSVKLGLQKKIHFPGYLNAADTQLMYASASVFILPSSHFEQWGLVVNEAMAAGLPVLVSNICGCVPDLVVEGVTGYSFDPGDVNELINQMISMSSGEIDLKLMGKNAKQQINGYTPELFAQNLINSAELAFENSKKRKWRKWPNPNLWF